MTIRTLLKVFIAGSVGVAACAGPEAGTQIWRFRTGYTVTAAPVYADGRIYAGSDKLYCLDAETGVPLWDFTPYGVISIPYGFMRTPVIADGGRVYLQCGGLYCLDAVSGRLLWEFWVDEWSDSGFKLGNGHVYVLAGNALVCLDAHSGRKIWQSAGIAQPLVIAADDARVYIGGMGVLAAFDVRTGSRVWVYNDWEDIAVPFVHHEHVYLSGWDTKLICLDGCSGAIVWRREIGFPAIHRLTAFKDMVYVFSNSIYAFKADTGQTEMKKNDDVQMGFGPPYHAGDGNIYSRSSNGTLYVLNHATAAVRSLGNVPGQRFTVAGNSCYLTAGRDILRLHLPGLSEQVSAGAQGVSDGARSVTD